MNWVLRINCPQRRERCDRGPHAGTLDRQSDHDAQLLKLILGSHVVTAHAFVTSWLVFGVSASLNLIQPLHVLCQAWAYWWPLKVKIKHFKMSKHLIKLFKTLVINRSLHSFLISLHKVCTSFFKFSFVYIQYFYYEFWKVSSKDKNKYSYLFEILSPNGVLQNVSCIKLILLKFSCMMF